MTTWPRLHARAAGGLYLIVILGGTFAEIVVRAQLIVPGDPTATAHNIHAHELLYRWGFVVEVFYCACNVPLVLILFNLFRVVDRSVALMMVFFAFVADAIESVSLIAHFAPLILLGTEHYLGAFTADQLNAAAYVSVELFERGFAVSLVFFGCDCLAMGYLIVQSQFLPRIIGVLLAIEGVGYVVNSALLFLAPALQARVFPYFSATAIAEVALCLWLLVMGVDVRRWKGQAAGATRSQQNSARST